MADRLPAHAEIATGHGDFGAWMAAEQKRIFLLCRRMLQDADEADGATQDSFLKAYEALKKSGVPLDDPGRWITRIAVNTCLDRLRSRKWQLWRKRPRPQDEAAILGAAPSLAPTAEDKMFASQIQGRIAQALEKLSARQRTVFTLKHYEGRTLDEIAGILDLDIGTVKAHMFRAVTKLRADLRDLYYGEGR
ncbi:MAG TPA: RNA polymerase sigma factor [Bryobacteraceae bacterium]|nr:RNA polymerase sigma factor [Bryobacteraceae bacterium]